MDVNEVTETPEKWAVVTGGGSGIGRAMALALSRDGFRVIVMGRRKDVLEEVAEQVDGIAIAADLSDPDDVERAAADVVVATAGTVDALVLNAGSGHQGPQDTLQQVADHWRSVVDANVLTTVLLEHALRPHLRRPGGRIVAVTSASARSPGGEVAYASMKAAINRWVVTVASQLGKEGITVNALSPGFVPDTGLYPGGIPEEWRSKIIKGIAVGRVGTPDDIAEALVWLVSDGAAFMTGTVMEVDGGRVSAL
jgi:3-oxoacyl-[acyl-carrier protein] reductase